MGLIKRVKEIAQGVVDYFMQQDIPVESVEIKPGVTMHIIPENITKEEFTEMKEKVVKQTKKEAAEKSRQPRSKEKKGDAVVEPTKKRYPRSKPTVDGVLPDGRAKRNDIRKVPKKKGNSKKRD
jgi:ribosome-binding ATPase YchF (GTP1/OBG family)